MLAAVFAAKKTWNIRRSINLPESRKHDPNQKKDRKQCNETFALHIAPTPARGRFLTTARLSKENNMACFVLTSVG